MPTEAWGPALATHRALYTPGILMAKNKAPYLVVQVSGGLCAPCDTQHSSSTPVLHASAVCLPQVDAEGNADVPGKGWLPFGFFWVPSKSETQLLTTTDSPTQVLLARYLQVSVRNLLRSVPGEGGGQFLKVSVTPGE